MSQQFQEHQGVRCKAHPNPRPIRDTKPVIDQKTIEQSAFNLDPIPFQRTLLEGMVFIGCMAAIGLLLIVGGAK